ncbi:MAG: acyl-CoA dehydrogenase family protein [Myxococcales bacterium]|nr:acyl-CoA dehydrogenase family protein [Myxococcales bacterium]
MKAEMTNAETTHAGGSDASQPEHRLAYADVAAWQRAQPESFYSADSHLRRVLPLYVAPERRTELERDLEQLGDDCAGPGDALARESNLDQNLPRLERWDPYGARQDIIVHHPTVHELGRLLYRGGIMQAYANHPDNLGVLARFYISAHLGEAGHNCPFACNAGAIRVLQALAPTALRERYLPRFLTRDYDTSYCASQFLTEITGGSDVGANATVARKQPDGRYRIFGEKWFASRIDADVFVMTARLEGAPAGTAGLGMFLVPRLLDDGVTPNDFAIRRLKTKLGTRTLASTEADFNGAWGHLIGGDRDGDKPGRSFVQLMTLVITTSRLFNAMGCAGLARRAYVTAQTYARHRRAFGRTIGDYPLVQQTLANTKAEVDAMLSGCLHTTWMHDRVDRGEADDVERAFVRMAVNLNKMRTAKSARWAIVEGIEVLGGNGAIETFSVLPRLLRDVIVFENWEGTHNTLLNQLARDMRKYRVHEGFFAYLERLCETLAEGPLAERMRAAMTSARAELESLLDSAPDDPALTLGLRPLFDALPYLSWAVIRAHETARLGTAQPVGDTLEHFVELRIAGAAPDIRSASYQRRIAAIARTL